jgi:hypothetical protein
MLKHYDDPDHWEYPSDFYYDQEIARYHTFVAQLCAALRMDLRSETGNLIQDASFHSQLFLPGKEGKPVALRFSNFGQMVSVYEEENVADILPTVKEILAKDYVYVPPRLLKRPYNGKNRVVTDIATWWQRYFDWV